MSVPRIIFQDDDFLVIDKPAGWVVNNSLEASKNMQPTVQDFVVKELGSAVFADSQSDFSKRAGIVHRIDKDTSGLLLVSKTQNSFEKLQKQFFERSVIKKYTALVHGKMRTSEGKSNKPIGRVPRNRRKFGVVNGGRDALTLWQVLGHFADDSGEYTLLELSPKTGRTHQLRVHMKHEGHPIVSDPLYVGRKVLKKDLSFCPRLFLHAGYIEFSHPTTGEVVSFESKLPLDLSLSLHTLRPSLN